MKISIGFSPCPNDTYIFDALINQKIDTAPFEFELTLADVEELNELALANKLDVTKLSYHAFSECCSSYDLLSAGSALGRGCGPLLISKQATEKQKLNERTIAIPGKLTTANFLLQFYNPEITKKQTVLFSEIEDLVLSEQVDAGVIIHENRFTYADRGLVLLQDLGAYWEEQSHFPIPLGGIVVKNTFDPENQSRLNQLIRSSIEYAHKHSSITLPKFIKDNAQEMSEEVMRKHINLYVNHFSTNLGQEGEAAIRYMMKSINPENQFKIVS